MKRMSVIIIVLFVFLMSGCVEKYSITFIDYDGSTIQVNEFEKGEDITGITYPEDPQREGYTFVGWSVEIPVAMTEFSFETEALYEINQYELKYMGLNDEILYSKEYDFNYEWTDVDFPIELRVLGFDLDDWRLLLPDKMPAENISVSPNWIRTIEEFEDYFLENGEKMEYIYNSEIYESYRIIIESNVEPNVNHIMIIMIQLDDYLGFVFGYSEPRQNGVQFFNMIQDYNEIFIQGDLVSVDMTYDPFNSSDLVETDFDLELLDFSVFGSVYQNDHRLNFAMTNTEYLITTAREWFETAFDLDLE